jgi:hypothetical protein
MKIMVLDVGGTHVKIYATGHVEPLKIDSGPDLAPKKMVKRVLKAIDGWKYDVVSIGYPGPVVHGKPLHDPANLGPGWVGFDFRKAFGCPVKQLIRVPHGTLLWLVDEAAAALRDRGAAQWAPIAATG